MVWDKKKNTLKCIVKHNEQLYDQLGCVITMVQTGMTTILYNYYINYKITNKIMCPQKN